MKRLLIACLAATGLMVSATGAKADWEPKVCNGFILGYYNPTDPFPSPPYQGGNWVYVWEWNMWHAYDQNKGQHP